MSGIVIGIKPHLLRDFLIYLEISLFELKGRIVKPKCLVKMFALTLIYLLQHVLGCFGVDRCMFGSDWPVCTLAKADYKRVFDLLQHLVRSMTVEDKKKIFRENAAKFYKLDLN